MAECSLCHMVSDFIPKVLNLCRNCIHRYPDQALAAAEKVHARCRRQFDLPSLPPSDPGGIPCHLCVNQCRMGENQAGYCGLRKNIQGRLIGNDPLKGRLSWYHDPLPTNCVGDWVCPGGTGSGFPRYARCQGAEYGFNNVAVFFHACSFDCLYCQNWHFKSQVPAYIGVGELIRDIRSDDACICFFGGDPTPQILFALKASQMAVKKQEGKLLRICWETNGSTSKRYLDQMVALSLASGGCIKFDLKAWDDTLHRVLTGVTNTQTLDNFGRVGRSIPKRPDPPLLIAATLLVPGFINEEEVGHLARFIASVNPDIPYSLLAFYPEFMMTDLPPTSADLAQRCLNAARQAGLTRVRIGNRHLLV